MMAEITITRTGENVFRVEVTEGASHSVHDVTATDADIQLYGVSVPPERLLEASFEFLLEREPKESILRKFALPVIEHYFPEYRTEIRKRLG